MKTETETAFSSDMLSCLIIVLFVSTIQHRAICDQCNEYQSCNNDIINSTTGYTLYCNGAESCNNSWIRSSSLGCTSYGSCCNSTTITYNYNDITYEQDCNSHGTCMESILSAVDAIFCGGSYSCSGSNLKFSGDGSKRIECTGLYSCSNTTFESPSSSYATHKYIYIYLWGVFSGYNSTIYSNGNDVTVYSYSYNSGYGLTLYCTGIDHDVCIVHCYGSANCVGLTIICSSTDATCIRCIDDECKVIPYISGSSNDNITKKWFINI